ncbi:hypothetical protein [Clostridium tarantellae]|nr:hypothetical protein [Clostridium tarantellae]
MKNIDLLKKDIIRVIESIDNYDKLLIIKCFIDSFVKKNRNNKK